MYLKKIHSVNVGPLLNADISFSFENDKPKPVIIVGENGTGKSVLLSNIVDSFYEIASKAFNNARYNDDMAEGQQYYKTITPQEIHIGKDFMYSYLEFIENSEIINYFFKSGNISVQSFLNTEKIYNNFDLTWNDNDNYKDTNASDTQARNIFSSNVICYFSPDRYEKPNWMGKKYYNISNIEHLSVKQKMNGLLYNSISVGNITSTTLQWLLDIIVDSRCDINYQMDAIHIVHSNIQDLLLLGIARENIEKIMGTILGKDIYFGLNYRNFNNSRFNINLKENGQIIVPSLDALSTGQIALFNMFATIIRYADFININKSINLNDITGIVVIDEIELHLHTNLQREILPKLLHLFPRIQFIISTHSPLFLLGMDEIFGKDGYEIYQMPSSIKISSEMFSEFQKAYKYFTETEKYRSSIKDSIEKNNERTLVVTEGSTDWKHMKAALNFFITKEDYLKKYSGLDFDFLEYEPENSKEDDCLKLKMGNTNLCKMCKQISKIKQTRKLIFIADADDKDTNKKISDENKIYKNWGNNVYSFVLPLPESRKNTPEISIEHYYTDEEIKTPIQINNITRRLYMGNEFYKTGLSLDRQYICLNKNSCGIDKIKIIDGDEISRVFSINEDGEGKVNLALSKMEFANRILDKKKEFENISFKNFELIFNVIKQILDEPLV